MELGRIGILAVVALGWCPGEALGEVRFNRDVRPILADRCFSCHGADEKTREAGLRLDLSEGAYADNDGVRAVVPGDVKGSELVRRIFAKDKDDVMPPADHPMQLKDSQKEVLKQWIAEGAKYEGHWGFVPAERGEERGAGAIDGFIQEGLVKERMEMSTEATRETLIRRLSLDLTGVPPTVEEVDAFLTDTKDGAYERVVDRLLASPRYGERMAMWWLDGARYADTHGFQADWERYQWPWRDWVINAFNSNQRFDEFTIDQIAGDMIPDARNDQVVATGFGRNHRINTEGGSIAEEWLIEHVMDRLETTGAVWMGLTLGCARCHDHKYDPLTQREFYEMFSIFHNVPEQGRGPEKPGNFEPTVKVKVPGLEEKRKKLDEEIAAVEKVLREKALEAVASLSGGGEEQKAISPDVLAALGTPHGERTKKQVELLVAHVSARPTVGMKGPMKTLANLQKSRSDLDKAVPTVMVMREMETPRKTFILDRGEYLHPTEEVQSGLPAFLPPLPEGEEMNRLGFARWLVNGEHPLTARVQVNRLWELVFGTGLVESSENLGVQADWPSHPELLDWLAVEFVESGWDVKGLMKTMVMTQAYRQDSAVDSVRLEKDPNNRLLSRGPRFRVQAEVVRDQALAIAGLLNEKVGGPSVRPYQPAGIWSEFNFYGNLKNYKHATDGSQYRRSLYTIWKRTAAPPGMTLFDMPSREVCTVKRSRTNTPLQALALMNEVTYVEASRKFAERMMGQGETPEEWLRWGWRAATAREASAEEMEVLLAGYERRLKFYGENPEAAAELLKAGEAPVAEDLDVVRLGALSTAASVILNLDEVITKG